MREEEKDLKGNEEAENVQSEGGEEEKEKKTIVQKISDIDPEEVGKKVDGFVGWVSDKLKGLKIDKSTEEGQKKAKERRSIIIGAVALLLIGNFLNGGITSIIPARFIVPHVVKTGTPLDYPNMTYEEAFNTVCKSGKWKYIGKQGDNYIVEYNGVSKINNDSKLCVQFTVDSNNPNYSSVSYMDVDGTSASDIYEIGIMMGIIMDYANSSISGDAVSAAADKVTTKKVSSNDVQAVAPAPTIPETEDDYVFDPNGAVKADSYYEEQNAAYPGETSGDLPDNYSDMPIANTLGSEYTFNTSLKFPELTSYDAWTKGKGQLWYCEDTGLYAYTDIDDSTGIPVVVFSTDGTYDGVVYRFVPQATDDSIGMLRAYGDFVDDNMIYRGANMGVTWNTNDYTAFYVSGPKDMPHMVIGNYFLQQQ